MIDEKHEKRMSKIKKAFYFQRHKQALEKCSNKLK